MDGTPFDPTGAKTDTEINSMRAELEVIAAGFARAAVVWAGRELYTATPPLLTAVLALPEDLLRARLLEGATTPGLKMRQLDAEGRLGPEQDV